MEPIRFVQGRPMLLAGLRRQHSFAESARGIAAQWEEFRQSGPIPHRQGSAVYGVICGGDLATQVLEYMCAVEVAEFDAAHAGRMRVPPQYYAVFDHPGHASGLQARWQAIWNDWLPRSGYTPVDGPEFEVYGEGFDPRMGLGGVEVWSPVQPPAGG